MRILLGLSAALICAISVPVFAQINIGAGSTVNFSDATVDFGCTDLIVAGQAISTSSALIGLRDLSISAGGNIVAGASQITLGRDFSNAGSFAAGAGTVRIVDTCGTLTSHVTGSTSFYGFVATTSSGKQLVLPAATTQSVSNSLTLAGSAGNLLQVQSSSAGQRANLAVAPAATQAISYVSARDNAATGAAIAPGSPASYNSVDDGNLVNWFLAAVGGGGTAVPAPGLDALGRLLLFAGVLIVAWRTSRKYRHNGA